MKVNCLECGEAFDVEGGSVGENVLCLHCGADFIFEGNNEEQTRTPSSGDGEVEDSGKLTPTEEELINLNCKSCGQSLDVPKELSGEEIECPSCNAPVFVEGGAEFFSDTMGGDSDELAALSEALPSVTMCHRHDDVPAILQCSKCGKDWCEDCIVQPGKIPFCNLCKARCNPIGDVTPPPFVHHSFGDLFKISFNPGQSGFFTILFAAIISSVVGGLLLMNLGSVLAKIMPMVQLFGQRALGPMTVTGSFILMLPWMALAAFYFGYCFNYAKVIAYEAAIGEESLPAVPRLNSFLGDTIGAFVQLCVLFVLSYGVGVGVVVGLSSMGIDHWLLLFLIPLSGGVLMPILLLWVAIVGGVATLELKFIVQALRVFSGRYWAVCFVFILFTVAIVFLFSYLLYWIGQGGDVYATLPVAAFGVLYALSVMMRLLGYLYYVNRAELGWLREER